MSLFEILACPNCRIRVDRYPDHLLCTKCGTKFPVIDNIPVMFPDGRIPVYTHQNDLTVRKGYDPWIHRVVIQSLLDDQIILDVGSGNMSLDDPCIIRMDITLTPYVDIVADLHALPFLPNSIDYIFSLAVFEHLENPFRAADSIYDVLKDGGFIYHECNFIWPYHGFPHHYFNASIQGLESVFSKFHTVKTGVAPYQMPSFALASVIESFLKLSGIEKHAHGESLAKHLQKAKDLINPSYDIYFQEDSAACLAAGVYFAGYKQAVCNATLVPEVISHIFENNEDIRCRFPNINNLFTSKNILLWVKTEGRALYPEIDTFLKGIAPFNKRGDEVPHGRIEILNMPIFESRFGAIGFDPDDSLIVKQEKSVARNFSLFRKTVYVLKTKGIAGVLHRLGLYFTKWFRH